MTATNQDLHDIRSLVLEYFRERRAFGKQNQSPSYGWAGDFIHPGSFSQMALNYRQGLEQLLSDGLAPLCEEGILEANAGGVFLTQKGASLI